jgi:hypothetical protein
MLGLTRLSDAKRWTVWSDDRRRLRPIVMTAMAAAAGIAVARTAAVTVGGTVLALFLGLAVGALIGLDQGLTVGDRNLVIVGMDFAEGEEAVAVAADHMPSTTTVPTTIQNTTGPNRTCLP